MSQVYGPTSGGGGGSGISTISGDIGSISGSAVTISGGTTGLVTDGSGTTMNIEGVLVVSNGGTGVSAVTAYAPLCGGTTSTAALQSASTGMSTVGFVFTSNGNSALPSWQAGTDTGSIHTITGNSGGAQAPIAANFTIVGSGNITTVSTSGTLTISLSGLSNHAVLLGTAGSTINNLPPSATAGVPIVSQGATSDPQYGTAVVAGGGTGVTSTSAFGVLCGGTTSTGAFQNAGTGSSGQFLTSQGSSALPTWLSASAAGIITWVVTNSTSITAVANTIYVLTANSLVTITLPDPATQGQIFGFVATGSTSFKITQDVLQQIQLLNQLTTLGSGGYLASTDNGSSVMLVATAVSSFQSLDFNGNIGWH